ncbi:hypothetical protein SIO70_15610 [Chitinophaga sancti]|nr:hypothetical protein [Chitinophaga sancti]WPQ66287.1 hypothetical protein SIO70_15610 [Chitinophaga sancti]
MAKGEIQQTLKKANLDAATAKNRYAELKAAAGNKLTWIPA